MLHTRVSFFPSCITLFFFNDPSTTEIYTLSLHDALPISGRGGNGQPAEVVAGHKLAGGDLSLSFNRQVPLVRRVIGERSEEHTSELQSLTNLVCRLLLEKKKKKR